MKTTITIFAIALALGAAAQEELKTIVLKESEIGCIIPPRSIEPTVYVWDADAYYRAQIKQPILSNEQFYGTMPLSEDLPFVHTLRGSVYTFDFLQYTVRN